MQHMVRHTLCLATVAGLTFGAMAESVGDYVQNGLVAHWDGIDNLADGTHHDDATVWKDKIAGYEFVLNGVTVGERYLGFNGSSSYGQLSAGAATAFPSGVKTVEILVKLDSTGQGIALHGPTGSGVAFGPYSSYVLLGNFAKTVGYSKPGTTETNAYGTVYGANNYPSALNLNGVTVASVNANSYWGTSDASAWIGRGSGGTYFNGKVYSIRVYNRALLAEEIAYNNAVDRARFLDDETTYPTVAKFRMADIPFTALTGSACEPRPEIFDLFTGQSVDSSNFDFTYESNAAPGTGTVIATGRAGSPYAGQVGRKSFVIGGVIRAKGDALDTGSGASWADAMTWANALNCAVTSDVPREIWLAGDLVLATGTSSSFKKCPVAIRGGFEGTENSASARKPGARSVLDASAVGTCFSMSNTKPVTIDSICFTRATITGISCNTTASGADVVLTNCAVTSCGKGSSWGGLGDALSTKGGGAIFTGNSGSTVTLVDCDISGQTSNAGNDIGVGGGAYLKGYGRAYFERCTVMTNICGALKRGQCFGLQFSNQPATLEGCTFAGNRARLDGGMVVQFSGACSGSVLRNCVFAGNSDTAGNGLVTANMSAADGTLAIENCTFAYNLVPKCSAIFVNTGTATVSNSIFYANERDASSAKGADISCGNAGSVVADYCMFSGTGSDHFTVSGSGSMDIRKTCFTVADPQFVTSSETFMNLTGVAAIPNGTGSFPDYPSSCSLDVHLLSAGGYFSNDGVERQAAGVFSPGIDAGDPNAPCDNEPPDNGGRLNLGAYGNTPFASKTPTFEVAIDDEVVVGFLAPYTQPVVTFTAGGSGAYSATAVIRIYLDGSDEPVWTSEEVKGVSLGQTVDYRVPDYYAPNASLVAAVELTAGAKSSAKSSSATTVTGELPPWAGKKGPEYVIHVRPGATGKGDGTSWTDAVETLFDGIKLATATRNEVWFAGTNVLAATSPSFSFAFPIAIRGGFEGTESSASARRPGARSVLDADAVDTCFKMSNTKPVTVDSILFTRAKQRGVDCTTSSADANVTFTNCAVTCCARDSVWGGLSGSNGGGGAMFVGVSGSMVRLVDCDISGNTSTPNSGDIGRGAGAFFKGYGRAYVEHCTVMTNTSRATKRASCHGLQFSNQPATLEGCTFAGNRARLQGMVVQFSDNCSGSVLRNCVFAGNVDSGATGLVAVNMSAAASTLSIENCTFAYNLVPNCSAVCVNTGTATVRNSIFYANEKAGTSTRGADIFCGTAGSVVADYCLFSGTGADHCSSSVDVRGTCFTADDPQFVTSSETFMGLTGVAAIPNGTGSFPDYPSSCSLDVHLLSAAGYFSNDGVERQAEGVLSRGIDTGDPDAPCDNEPPDNGGRLNLGAYGNTPFASKTPTSEVKVEGEVVVGFLAPYTQPVVTFTAGGSGAYSATAVIRLYLNGSEEPVWTSDALEGVSLGQTVDYRVPDYFAPNASLVAAVELTAGAKSSSKSSSATTVTGELPPWAGKKGPEYVIHVRPGATGKGDGTSWTDAVETLFDGIKLASATRHEVWFAGTNVLSATSPTFNFSEPVAIRGGFEGTERSLSDRKPGVRGLVDGCEQYDCLVFENTAAVTVDSIEFTRGTNHGLRKEKGSGDLFITNCAFTACGVNNTLGDYNSDTAGNGGTGLSIVGDGKSEVTVVDSEIRGNRISNWYGAVGVGCVAFKLARFTMDGCTLVDNHHTSGYNGGGQGLYAYAAPVTIRNTRFANNSASCANASVLWLNGASGGSVIENCVFAGNPNGNSKGMVRVSLASTNDTVEVSNCTFAYNFVSGNSAVRVGSGAVKVRNSVFWGNLVAEASTIGADIHLGANGHADVAYSLFGGDSASYVSAADESHLAMTNCVTRDPRFVTSTDEFVSAAKVTGELPRTAYTTPSAEVIRSFNVHLRGGAGYLDERTGLMDKAYARQRFRSPALDAGDPKVRCTEPKPNGHRVNLGAYGNTPWATRSPAGMLFFLK